MTAKQDSRKRLHPHSIHNLAITPEGESGTDGHADEDLILPEQQRVNETVLPLNDLIRDAYERVIHFADHRGSEMFANRMIVATSATAGALEEK